MKKFVLPLVLASMAVSPIALGQNAKRQAADEKAYNLLVDQYATTSLGYFIEQRCHQLDPGAFADFETNQKMLDGFMVILMGGDDNVKLLDGVKETAADAETNPCNIDTFRFALATYQISSQLATRVKLLGEEELIKLNQALNKQVQEKQAEINQTQGQTAVPPQPTTTTTQEVTQVTPQPEPEPEPQEPKSTFETLTPTDVTRQPGGSRPQTSTTSTDATPTTTSQQPASQAAAATGILLANYVNPFPYSPPQAAPGETEKDMKRRHRQEIIDLRRSQRAEMDAFKDNEEAYANPKAVKDFIEDRQDDDFDAMRNRHRQELSRF